MCTAITFQSRDFYLGRTLDHPASYGEEVVITPRRFPLHLRNGLELREHYALIGMAHREEGFPLYYDGANEAGLAMAALSFPGFSRLGSFRPRWENIAQFEFIPWLLGCCADLADVRRRLQRLQLTDTPFSRSLPPSPLHWLVADRSGALAVEAMEDGLHVLEDPPGVLTNAPPLPWQLHALSRCAALSPDPPAFRFPPPESSLGMGTVGLPGDLTSTSRFIRAAFLRAHALPGESEEESVGQLFHILAGVEQVMGCCRTASGGWEHTLYTGCINATRGIYYYTTYGNRQISAVALSAADPDGTLPVAFPLRREQAIHRQG